MVRTDVVILSAIKGYAYRQKLKDGGSGIIIFREGASQPGIASISKTSGEPFPTANTPADLYPAEAFREAMELTAGMPYKKQGTATVKGKKLSVPKEAVPEEPVPEEAVVDSADYQKIVDKYTDKNGKLSYSLLNKDMIRFAHSSSIVRKMIAEGESVDAIRLYTVGAKYRSITGDHSLTDDQVRKITDLLDEVSPKGVYREFNDQIRKELKAAKK